MIEKLKRRVIDRIEDVSDEIVAISEKIHSDPELGLEEYKAQGWLTESLEDAGYAIERGLAGMETAFRAVHPETSPGPTIAILAEYDALPDLGHACGHNLIAGAALGAGLGLFGLKSEIPGRLEVIGTPAEESEGAKVTMVNSGVFDEVDVAMMFHPSTTTASYSRSAASLEVELTFEGQSTHAAASPEKGVDPLTALIQTFVCVDTLRQSNPEDTRIHGVITDGGKKPNMFPKTVTARFTIRGSTNEKRDQVVDKLRACAESAAESTGAGLSFDKANQGYQALIPHRKLAKVFGTNLERLGEDVEEGEDSMGSTDMGDVSQVCAAIHPYISIADEEVAGHSPEFAKAAASESGYQAMLTAAKALALTAIDVAVDQELFQKIRARD
ncbi:MAG: amidohydrolase [Candidatus Acetothermia bacterium]